MKRQWHVRRQMLPRMDGQRRWDRAYQLLGEWAATRENVTCAPGGVGPRSDSDEEAEHARRRVCARLDAAPGPAADD